MDLLTNSRLKSFRACPRRHHLEYVEGYRPAVEDEALSFGTAFHVPCEAYWTARRDGHADPLACALDAIEGDELRAARLRPMLIGYAASWASVECEVLAVEKQFELPLVNPATNCPSRTWVLSGKIDLVLRFPDGRIAIVDHKTSGESIEPGSDFRRRLILDGQLSQYWRGCSALGWEPDFGIWDVVGKPRLSPLKATPIEEREYTKEKSRACVVCRRKDGMLTAPHFDAELRRGCIDGRIVTDPGGRLYANQREADETPDEFEIRISEALAEDPARYFARIEVQRLEMEREQYDVNVWHLAREMREAREYGRAIYNPDACMRGRTPCPFLGFCEGTADLDDPTRFRRIDPAHPHEELSRAKPHEAA